MSHPKLFFAILSSLLFPISVFAHSLAIKCPHATLPFDVELAHTPDEQAKGLMYRTSLLENEGMLFLYPQPQPVAMWMKNTLISLDMIFCDKEGYILSIQENTTPLSLHTIGPVKGTSQVLEIKGGIVKQKGISKECKLSLDH